jgi:hypothetical protein
MSVRAVLAVWSLTLVAAAGGVSLILASDRSRPVASIPLELLVGLAFVGSGLLARVRRPENRTGVLMMLVGFAWFGGALTAADQSLPYTIGYVEGGLIGALFVHLVLAFPSGRLETKAERRVTAGMYVFALVLQPTLLLFDDLHGLKCDACPENASCEAGWRARRSRSSSWSSATRRCREGSGTRSRAPSATPRSNSLTGCAMTRSSTSRAAWLPCLRTARVAWPRWSSGQGGAWPPSSTMPRFATIPNSLTP